jgi:hypothetical protein
MTRMPFLHHEVDDPSQGRPFRRIQRIIQSRINARRFANRYPYRNLLVVALPGCGSTWLERMLCDIPGFLEWRPKLKRTTFPPLPDSFAYRIPLGFTVTRLHVQPTEDNRRVIHRSARPYVVLLRDIRDAAVSWCFHVAAENGHRLHSTISALSMSQRLDWFIEHHLDTHAGFLRGWLEHHHPNLGLVISYDELKCDSRAVFGRVLEHYEIDLPAGIVDAIVANRAFTTKVIARETGSSTGTDTGTGTDNGSSPNGNSTTVTRKAIVGVWQKHLNDRHIDAFEKACGDLLASPLSLAKSHA